MAVKTGAYRKMFQHASLFVLPMAINAVLKKIYKHFKLLWALIICSLNKGRGIPTCHILMSLATMN